MANVSDTGAARQVSMSDVAAAAGVSQQTVSRVVNDSPNVSEATRAKVRRAMDKLGFRPNFAGRSLRNGSFRTVGLCLYDLYQAGNLATLGGISTAARTHGYAITLTTLRAGEDATLGEISRRMTSLPVDGLIIRMPEMLCDFDDFAPLPGVPTVLLSMYSHPRCSTVESDQYGCSVLAVNHLAGRGHREIRFVSGPSDAIDAQFREAGWRETLESLGLAYTEPLAGDWGADSGYEAGSLLAKDRAMTAVYVANDTMALGVVEALRDAGVRVPEDVSVIGVDDSLTNTVPNNALTSIKLDYDACGKTAFEMVLRGLGGDVRVETTRLPCELVERATVADAPAR